jgi:hypothetical protein
MRGRRELLYSLFQEFIDSTNSTTCRDKTGAMEVLRADFFCQG